MATPPDFSVGQVLTAAHMDAVGLWRTATSTAGTAVSTHVVSSCFPSDYNAFRVVITNLTMSSTATGTVVYCKMHDGTNPANTNYNYGFVRIDQASGALAGTVAALGTNGVIIGTGTGDKFATSFDILQPNLAVHTIFPALSITNVSTGYAYSGSGMHQTSTAYTGFQLSLSTGTMTGGTITVYGYNKLS